MRMQLAVLIILHLRVAGCRDPYCDAGAVSTCEREFMHLRISKGRGPTSSALYPAKSLVPGVIAVLRRRKGSELFKVVSLLFMLAIHRSFYPFVSFHLKSILYSFDRIHALGFIIYIFLRL
jgi:hypothetical protein